MRAAKVKVRTNMSREPKRLGTPVINILFLSEAFLLITEVSPKVTQLHFA